MYKQRLTTRPEFDKIYPLSLQEGEKMLEELDTKIITETETQAISLSTAASDAVRNILTERNLEGYALRVYVAGGGCCSVNFGMALDNNIRDVDTTFEANGVKVVVDEVSIDYLRGATIDFVNDPVRGAGFAVDSPRAKSHSHEHAEGECACGGSCSCNN
ncbi:MAG: iron-sulfur cluster assembly accessory protein [Chloroflexi bacterium]|nr:MAG: iron-sulfur cluster assembly accessory protein [Chloroflexota bacterium]